MEIITNITQHELTQAQSNGEVESKIKLRKPSHINLVEHVKNIPYIVVASQTPEETQHIQQPAALEFPTSTNKNDIADFNEYVIQLSNATQLINNTKEEASLAQEKVKVSDGEVNRLSVEVSELEKQELDIEMRNSELDQQLVEAYNHQSQILELIRKEQERIIQEANSRERENQEKIVEFQTKINNIRERITTKSEDFARKQEVLRALQQPEISEISNLVDFTNTEEEPVKKMA